MVSKPAGMRTQLLLGLVFMIAVATVSVGAITAWATRWQVAEQRLAHGRLLGQTLAWVLAPVLERRGELQRAVSAVVGGDVRRIQVVDRASRPLAAAGPTYGRPLDDPTLVQALSLEKTRAQLVEDDGATRLQVAAPILIRGRLAGAARMEVSVGEGGLRWPTLFWVLMAFDGLLLVLFVGFVLTRYVVKPVERIQRAALQVTEGDLFARVAPEGGAELVSLAESFNSMTAHLRDQLNRLERQREEIVATREQVVRSEKLASVGRLAAGVAHEVGNPLQAIVGFSDMLARGGLDEGQEADFHARLKSEAERIHQIIRQLLDYARPVEDAIEPVDLAAVVEQSLQLVGPQRKLKQVEVEREGLGQLPPAAANTQRLVQVLVNLLLNAADAIAEGERPPRSQGGEGEGAGTVTVRGQPLDDDQVEIRISNTGPAIPLEDRGRLFDPFFTTKDPGEGTGLGLSVAQSIIESYGGRLELADDEQAPEQAQQAVAVEEEGGDADRGVPSRRRPIMKTTFVVTLHRWKEG
jgi:signal transduction histidine kinase